TLFPPKSDEQLGFTVDPQSGIPPFTSTLKVYTTGTTKATRWWFTIGAKGDGVYHKTDEVYLIVEERRCIIATTAYGSELNPHIQFLRGFRENIVLTTFAGRQ
ncbi:MAG: hypothetical protein QW815_06210, partial [Nitrososphaerota archaeon]